MYVSKFGHRLTCFTDGYLGMNFIEHFCMWSYYFYKNCCELCLCVFQWLKESEKILESENIQ